MMISRLRLENPGAVDVAKLLNGGEYWIHQEMSRMFAEDGLASRAFVYRRDDRDGCPECLVVSAGPPVFETNAWSVETKSYSPRFQVGEHFTFRLRANPVVTRRVGPGHRHARHDVVMDAKRQVKDLGGQTACVADICQAAGSAWIDRKGEQHGFAVVEDSLVVGGYRQHVIPKVKRQPIRLSTLEFDGRLIVTDRDEFLAALFSGVGPAKGFGCGLLLVKRV